MNRKKLKEDAKLKLQGKYDESFIVLLITGLLPGAVASMLPFGKFVGPIISFLLQAAMFFGYQSFFLKISRNQKVTYKELYDKRTMILPYITITLLGTLFVSLWTLLLIIPGIIASLSYSQAYYIALDNPQLKTTEVLKESKKLMEGHKWEYFVLQLSFIG